MISTSSLRLQRRTKQADTGWWRPGVPAARYSVRLPSSGRVATIQATSSLTSTGVNSARYPYSVHGWDKTGLGRQPRWTSWCKRTGGASVTILQTSSPPTGSGWQRARRQGKAMSCCTAGSTQLRTSSASASMLRRGSGPVFPSIRSTGRFEYGTLRPQALGAGYSWHRWQMRCQTTSTGLPSR